MDLITLTPRLHMFRFPIGQAYLWQDADDDLTLVDSGDVNAAPAIEAGIRSLGLDPAHIRRIVLTHCHPDHIGSAGELADRHGAAVVAHRLDAPVIRGETSAPEPVLLDWEKPMYEHALTVPPAPATHIDREVVDGDGLDFGDGAVAVHIPGHTEGSIGVHLPRHSVLFTGDTVARTDRVILGVFNADRARTVESMRRLAGLKPSVVCFGHGEPLTRDAAAVLSAAADEAAHSG
jgi:glyoxylase-like metal-dependent hydrolase (beta-lactamase superfamily II)